MDTLKRRVREYDLRRNSDRQMNATERAAELKRICLECRRSPRTMRQIWECQSCGGKIVEITV